MEAFSLLSTIEKTDYILNSQKYFYAMHYMIITCSYAVKYFM